MAVPERIFCLQLLPLVLFQHATHPEQHTGIELFQLSPGLRDAIDLGKNFRFIRLVDRKQRLHIGLFFP